MELYLSIIQGQGSLAIYFSESKIQVGDTIQLSLTNTWTWKGERGFSSGPYHITKGLNYRKILLMGRKKSLPVFEVSKP